MNAANTGPQEILLAEPRGFCAGVDRAIEIVERALSKFGAPMSGAGSKWGEPVTRQTPT